ncbi:RHS repeat protein [Pseudomonas fluorescens]|nr:RHS repeat protein [Pseudomonas fluorescens]
MLTETKNGVTETFAYDNEGNMSSKTTPGGGLYTYSNFKRGIPQTEKRPESIVITRIVDDAGNIISETNGEGRTTTYTYDGLNRQVAVTPPVGVPQTSAYTSTTKTVTRGALVEKTIYDPFGRPASITRAGITKSFTYDGLGRVVFESNPGVSSGTTYQYDALNRLTRQTNADGTFQTRKYGPANMAVTDERGKTTTYTYRAYGDPDKQLLMAITSPEASANVSIERGSNDLITSVTQAGLKRTYGYDSHNYLTSVTNPETGVTTYGRDISGNMISKKVGTSGITKYTYDALDRLTTTTFPGSTPAITNTYNKDSKLLTSNSSGGNRSLVYDAAGNVIQESLALDGRVFTAKYAYNGNDQLSSITYPQSDRVVNYTPDALGRPTTVSGYVTNVKYWPSGLIQSITYNNGTVSSYGQNARLWPSSFTTQKTTPASTYLNNSYTYDGVGNLVSIRDTVDSSFNRTLGYDNINRLTSAAGFWGQGSITYDGGGNLTAQTLGQSSLVYSYDANNRLSSVRGLRADTFGYDTYGNVASRTGTTYTYNDVPNLVCINCANPASKVGYSYDGLNHRSAVTKASGKVYEMHDSSGKPLIELDGNRLTEYFYLGDKRIAQRVSP